MQLAMRTEASSRHEKALAPALTDAGAARAAQLMTQCGAHAYRPHAFGAAVADGEVISLTARDVERILGLQLDAERIGQHLRALGCNVVVAGDSLTVTPPAWRTDLTIAADLVEEVARMEGYDSIESVEPSVPSHEISSAQYVLENGLADTLAALAYREIVSYSLQGSKLFSVVERAGLEPSHSIVEVRNPLSEDQRFLRWALGPGLLEYFARVDAPVRVFEIGHVFSNDQKPISEVPVLCFGFTAEPANEPDWRDSHFLRLKGDAEALIRAVSGIAAEVTRDVRNGLHPGKTAVLMHRGREIANLGKVDPRLARAFDVRLPAYLCNIYLENIPEYVIPRYRPPSKLPSTYRDLAVLVDFDVTAERIETVVREAIGELCTSVRVFDEYRGPQVGEGKKSVAVRAIIQRTDATITDEEADAAMQRAIVALREAVGGSIRE